MTKSFNRRTMLKTAGAAAACTGIGLSAPNVIRANDKVVRYLGTATTMGSEIDKKLFEDTGIKVQYIPVTTDEVTKRVLTQPNSFDIVDTEYFSLPTLDPRATFSAWTPSASRSSTVAAPPTSLARSVARKSVTRAPRQRRCFI